MKIAIIVLMMIFSLSVYAFECPDNDMDGRPEACYDPEDNKIIKAEDPCYGVFNEEDKPGVSYVFEGGVWVSKTVNNCADVNGDGSVDQLDFNYIQSHRGDSGPWMGFALPKNTNGDYNGNRIFDIGDLQCQHKAMQLQHVNAYWSNPIIIQGCYWDFIAIGSDGWPSSGRFIP